MREAAQQITQDILHFIDHYHLGVHHPKTVETEFNTLALELFRYQFQNNLPYKKFCQVRRRTPLTVKHWLDIPPMPIQGFKQLSLSCEPIEEVRAVFMTSGTTNPELKGKNYHPDLSVWDASMEGPFKTFVLPDREEMTIFVLSPAEDLNKNSSLSRYLTHAVTTFGSDHSRFFFNENGLDMEGLIDALKDCAERNEPVLLMGATFSYVHFLDYLEEHQITFQLAKGSRIFDTGGFKGQSREVEMEQLYARFYNYFNVGRNGCVNMYGMTEMSSQIYDQTLLTASETDSVIRDKTGPAWVKTVILDTNTLDPVKIGETGVIAHYDLANWNSCLGILTEDLGCKTEHGFVLLGRIKGSEARGCSIAVDQLLQSNLGGGQR
ncbi:hypothetical protein JOD43_001551 [Pullulanibacillus pueri]|uniref:Coenzyme F390 synthetase n=1 Tax=Pullulanibacillus pueri TaxID=1437324 RepID=A0A8J2ZUJ4_9BACL|nr:CoF synthetase [Pullulanibacillus pueri]MBM7681384.1 hypothetical protein [Pullulanibacillus pueri]GGH78666.1 coenzyme F390 synthetase [Pullulanibacillus pueri]